MGHKSGQGHNVGSSNGCNPPRANDHHEDDREEGPPQDDDHEEPRYDDQEVPPSSDEDDAIYCELCNMHLANAAQWEDHRTGKRHLKNARQAAEARAASSSTGAASSSTAVPKTAPPPLPAFLLSQPGDPASGYVYLRCYNALSSEEIGFIKVLSDASWGFIAARVGQRMLDYQVAPPVNAVNMRARDMEGVPLVRRSTCDPM